MPSINRHSSLAAAENRVIMTLEPLYSDLSQATPRGWQPGGLYDPRREHDACGVGFVCELNGGASHAIVRSGLDILANLAHRGAAGCDETTGDGAGILLQLPHRFLKKAARAERIDLPAAGDYGAGLVFLPRDGGERRHCMALLERAAAAEGLRVLGWRPVPVDNRDIGELSRLLEPAVQQVFVAPDRTAADGSAFERQLYVVRKVAESAVAASTLPHKAMFHIPSLSSRTLVYKGMFLATQLEGYFTDLSDPDMNSALAIVHQRYSTNTFPAWHLAQPFRFLCHNGEINTLRGNVNWLNARQHRFASERFGADIHKLMPVATPGGSDSAILDNTVELLFHAGRSLPHIVMMLIPEAWQNHRTMRVEKKDFYDYHASLMEPWDGPAAIAFSDGRFVGAVLDRNGLRPSRYTVTRSGRVIMASETGVLDIRADDVQRKGRLEPGRMFLVDLAEGRIVEDEEIKERIVRRRPYGRWLQTHRLALKDLPAPDPDGTRPPSPSPPADLTLRQLTFGYSAEDVQLLLEPMAAKGKEPVGSMGDDIPPAVLSRQSRLLYDYFRQLFAQVTNPPLDAIREALVTSLRTTIGPEENLLAETPEHCRQVVLDGPVLTDVEFQQLKDLAPKGFASAVLEITYPRSAGADGLRSAMDRLCLDARQAVADGAAFLILSDRSADRDHLPIPALLATAGVHHDLIRSGLRTRCAIVVDSGEPREVHHFCCLLGYGAGAVHPYLALETVRDLVHTHGLPGIDADRSVANYREAVENGVLKVMSKMGISTLQSYRGAQIFECLGLDADLVDRWFTGTVSRIAGADLKRIAAEVELRHCRAYPERSAAGTLGPGGKYKWRRDGETHQYNPLMLAEFRQAVFNRDPAAWQRYTRQVTEQNRREGLLRGLLKFRPAADPVPLAQVEPWTEIVKRFKTGAMSYGSISKEAHEALAVAMNRIGARSNSGEGGEDPDRFRPDPNGDWRNSAIKQVASGRFGVTGHYLVNAGELQIKMAQGAKPGEGGQLPGFKVYPWIAKTRHCTPYVGLISPPPHHDIYSIEDLAQLIYDLRCANPGARISVKLVSEVGVGTVAAGVTKGGADVVLVSGETGGTGAAPLTSIRHGGLPWELGLPEAHQTLVVNGLRSRVVLECDGQLKTGRDVAVACLLGAEEFGFGTIALVALGCIMMRVCHLNTCPVGIATQDPQLRRRFNGKPDHVVNLMALVAEELREIMAGLGLRSVAEMVGRVDLLDGAEAVDHWKANGLDLSAVLHRPRTPADVAAACGTPPVRGRGPSVDAVLIEKAKPALESGRPVKIDLPIRNVHRTVGTRLSSRIFKTLGAEGLPDDTITVHCRGSAGQSFFAFGAPGITALVEGDANDYFGKGLSGARLILRPPAGAGFVAEENVIVGNVALYGATAGQAYIRGVAGERFCVRNSGARAVVEGTGDHACEYMTGGRVVILGRTGRNTAAGMSGGIAYVFDAAGDFARQRCNREMVDLEVPADKDFAELRELIENHRRFTGSPVADRILAQWQTLRQQFVKIMPREYKKALQKLSQEHQTDNAAT